jgi:hypothetical protein
MPHVLQGGMVLFVFFQSEMSMTICFCAGHSVNSYFDWIIVDKTAKTEIW